MQIVVLTRCTCLLQASGGVEDYQKKIGHEQNDKISKHGCPRLCGGHHYRLFHR